MTKQEAAKERYSGQTFDYALPREWVVFMEQKGYSVVPNFVWLYPKGSIWGEPGPITEEGDRITKLYASGKY